MHIYQISRLYRKDASTWENLLIRLEQGKDYMAQRYAPLRRAICSEISQTGSGMAVLRAELSRANAQRGMATVARKSFHAFDVYLANIAPCVSGFRKSFVSGLRLAPVNFGGYSLTGRFHAHVLDAHRDDAYLYFSCSDWDEDEENAFVECLAIIGEQRHKAKRDSVWFVDLNRGIVVRPQKSYKRLRQGLLRTVQHLDRFMRAITTEDDD